MLNTTLYKNNKKKEETKTKYEQMNTEMNITKRTDSANNKIAMAQKRAKLAKDKVKG